MRTKSHDDGNCSLLFSSFVYSCWGSLVCPFDAIYIRVVCRMHECWTSNIQHGRSSIAFVFGITTITAHHTNSSASFFPLRFLILYHRNLFFGCQAPYEHSREAANGVNILWLCAGLTGDGTQKATESRYKEKSKHDRPTDRSSVRQNRIPMTIDNAVALNRLQCGLRGIPLDETFYLQRINANRIELGNQ